MIDFMKLANEALDAACGEAIRFKPHAVQAAASVLEQAFTAAVEEERRKALEEAATIARDFSNEAALTIEGRTGETSGAVMAVRGNVAAGIHIASAIRDLIDQPHPPMPV